jgi:hypothetical protein
MFPPRFAPILQEMEPLAALFREAGHRLFLVGGSVRDLLLGDTDAGTDLDLIVLPGDIASLGIACRGALWRPDLGGEVIRNSEAAEQSTQ